MSVFSVHSVSCQGPCCFTDVILDLDFLWLETLARCSVRESHWVASSDPCWVGSLSLSSWLLTLCYVYQGPHHGHVMIFEPSPWQLKLHNLLMKTARCSWKLQKKEQDLSFRQTPTFLQITAHPRMFFGNSFLLDPEWMHVWVLLEITNGMIMVVQYNKELASAIH